ncbi:MAG: hypothetical protein ACR2J4_05195 [Deinococcus sp.]
MTDPQQEPVEYQENVEQERVVTTEKWGEENKLPQEKGEEYWSDVSDENREEDGGAATGGNA